MLTTDAIKYFGSKRKLAEAAGVKAPTVYAWGRLVPEGKAARLSLMTDGELVYDPKAYQMPAKSA
ncbi:Cro/CI family transcriptional regulator [Klebsiella pasteurii]|uniref:Cro/CI family transcriptional regulator n=1 Tax=Klebsiella pasteurii TaxID=2587529 RepID=UPI00287E8904|nr:Cro/CI family transcriptional regulator [Klebsiella pasteurii]MDS7909038.1 Cro/CI family transcriptional regulator [Klebsiella pasteurii]MDV0995912.1 Cro/CI family transcriptional regulator [Klebsiella pasteurii]